jgi:Leucine-rich repeat (LRR) protein
MKNLLSLLIFALVATNANAQYTYVPDDNFEQRLIALGWDDVLDDYVLTANISGRTYLDVNDRGITDLTGIKDFTSLQTLNCGLNPITNLDLSGMTALQTLNATGNYQWYDNCSKCISTIDVTGCTSLATLNIGENNFQSITLNCPNLTYLNCHNNKISSIDLSQSPLLNYLDIGSNYDLPSGTSINQLDLSNNPLLETVYANSIGLNTINLTNCSNLIILELHKAVTTYLDITNCTKLERLMLDAYRLTSLDLSNNLLLRHLYVRNLNIDLNLNNNVNLIALGLVSSYGMVDASNCSKLDDIILGNVKHAKINFKSFDSGSNGYCECFIRYVDCLQVVDRNVSYIEPWFNNVAYAGTEPCEFTNVPDWNFENTLISLGYDAVQNGTVTTQAISNITSLDVSNKNISDFTGLEGFSSIQHLNISGNKSANLDFANSILKSPANTTLETLNISNSSNLVSVNLSTNDKLTSISAANNPLLENMKLNFKVLNTASSDITNTPNLECIQVFDKDASTIATGAWLDGQITLTNSSCNPLGLNEATHLISVTPNPFTSEIIISGIENIKTLSVTDINGRLVYLVNNPSRIVDLSSIESGSYFLRIITTDGTTSNHKLIKQ